MAKNARLEKGQFGVRFGWGPGSSEDAVQELDIYAFLYQNEKFSKKDIVCRSAGKNVHSSNAVWTLKDHDKFGLTEDVPPEGSIMRLGMNLSQLPSKIDRVVVALYMNTIFSHLGRFRNGYAVLVDNEKDEEILRVPFNPPEPNRVRAMAFFETKRNPDGQWQINEINQYAPPFPITRTSSSEIVDWAEKGFPNTQ